MNTLNYRVKVHRVVPTDIDDRVRVYVADSIAFSFVEEAQLAPPVGATVHIRLQWNGG